MLAVYILLTLIVLWVDFMLTSGGIHSVVTVLLMVVLYNLHQVKQMLRELKGTVEKKSPGSKPSWTCVCCGTKNQGNVSWCTNCNAEREWSKMKEQEENG